MHALNNVVCVINIYSGSDNITMCAHRLYPIV